MKKSFVLLTIMILALLGAVDAKGQGIINASNNISSNGLVCHPWYGKRVAYLGDSITDPNSCSDNVPEKYWGFLNQWLNITPFVYGVSGRQWNDIPRQVEKLKTEHGDDVDAIIVFIGTNDYNAGVPIGKWFEEYEDTVTAGSKNRLGLYKRIKRVLIMSDTTFCGRINIGVSRLKTLYPGKQIVLLTPLHRAFASFTKNVQPDENCQNFCGEYIDKYVTTIKEAANVWGIPVIDLNAVSGMNPMIDSQIPYFNKRTTDKLHPSTLGQKRMARTLLYQLATLPVDFE